MKSPIAHRYAQALLQHARKEEAIDEVRQDAERFIGLYKASARLASFLNNPVIRPSHQQHLLEKGLLASFHPMTARFFKLVIHKKRTPHLYAILTCFLDMHQKQLHIHTLHITAAHPLAPSMINELCKLAKKIFHISNVAPHLNIDPSILGGYILRIGDYYLNASIEKKLQDLLFFWQKKQIKPAG